MSTLKYGKLAPKFDARTLMFADYLQPKVVTVPPKFGHGSLVPSYGMLGNDQYGDCGFAGGAHEHMLWTAACGAPVTFDEQGVIQQYLAYTGGEDSGVVILDYLKYRKKHGLIDSAGKRHTIDFYAQLEPGNVDQLEQAMYLFGAVALGFEMPNSAMTQFDKGKPWSVVSGARIEGGHYVPGIGKHESKNFEIVTWGKQQIVTPGFYKKYNDEAWVLICLDYLKGGKTPEGFDLATLQADAKKLAHVA